MLKDIGQLSIVVCVLNEVENVGVLIDRIYATVEHIPEVADFEVIVVDDGSTDGTVALLERMTKDHPRLSAILLRRNFGKSAALMAGFREASGEIVVTMDGDLQDDPADIPLFLEGIQQG